MKERNNAITQGDREGGRKRQETMKQSLPEALMAKLLGQAKG